MKDEKLYIVVNDWIAWLETEKRYSINTVDSYVRDVGNFIKFLYECFSRPVTLEDIVNIKVASFRKWFTFRYQDGIEAVTNARSLSALKNFFRYLSRAYNINSQAIFCLSKPILKSTLPKILGEDHIKKILNYYNLTSHYDWVSKRDFALMMLLYGCGLRISEAINLKFRDIRKEEILVIGKGNKERILPVLPMVYEKLNEYIECCPYHFGSSLSNDQYIFLGAKGKKLSRNYFANKVQKVRKEINLPDITTPHTFRHSFATHLFLGGADIRSVQELLGHANLATTQIYTHLDHQSMIDHYKNFHPQMVKKNT
ncbi:tyrosine recombinase XerC [Ehrlichia sp. JZT12]